MNLCGLIIPPQSNLDGIVLSEYSQILASFQSSRDNSSENSERSCIGSRIILRCVNHQRTLHTQIQSEKHKQIFILKKETNIGIALEHLLSHSGFTRSQPRLFHLLPCILLRRFNVLGHHINESCNYLVHEPIRTFRLCSPLKSPKYLLQIRAISGLTFILCSSFVNLIPNSFIIEGRQVSTSPTTSINHNRY